MEGMWDTDSSFKVKRYEVSVSYQDSGICAEPWRWQDGWRGLTEWERTCRCGGARYLGATERLSPDGYHSSIYLSHAGHGKAKIFFFFFVHGLVNERAWSEKRRKQEDREHTFHISISIVPHVYGEEGLLRDRSWGSLKWRRESKGRHVLDWKLPDMYVWSSVHSLPSMSLFLPLFGN